MKPRARWRLWLALVVAPAVAVLWFAGPYEDVSLVPDADSGQVGDDLDAHFAAAESRFDDITPGVEKRVVWAGAPGVQTDVSLLYVHGFSATSEEIRPVPDLAAVELGANLVFTRLTGHGRDGAAMAEARVQDWIDDVAEGLAAARSAGREVIVLATSTGATLVAAAALDPEMMRNVRGVALVSPNFGIRNPWAPLLTWPGARHWLPVVAGQERSFVPLNAEQARYWTIEYPTVAVLPMAALVRKVVDLDFSRASVPALFYFSRDDRIVDAALTEGIAEIWGTSVGPGLATVVHPSLGPRDDPDAHVIAGAIMSPEQTDVAVERIVDWIRGM